MSCTCNNGYVTVATGNSFLMKLHLAQWDPAVKQNVEYPMDNAQNVAVRFIGNNGKCIKYTDIGIDGSTLTFLVDGARLIPAKYSIEIKFTMDGLNKRAYRCGLLNVVNCGQCINNALNEDCEIDVIFNEDNEIINIGGVVWAAVDDHLDKNSQNPVTNSAITNTLENDYASKQWVIDVMTDGQIDLSSYVSDAELAETLTSYVKTDVLDETLNSYVNVDTLNETLSSYVTNQQMQEAIEAIPETDLSNYYNKQEVDNLIDNIPETDLSNYYNKQEVDNLIDNIPETDLSDYYTKSEIDDKFDNIDIPDVDMSSYVTKTQLADSHFAYSYQIADLTQELIDDERVIATHGNKIENLTSYFPSYATIDYVNSIVVGGDIDLSAYVTKAELSQNDYAYNSALSDYTTLTQFNESVNNLQNQIDNIEPSTDVDLSAYVKKSELHQNNYAYKNDLNDYYTKTQVDDIVDNLQPTVDLTSYVTHDFLSQQSYVTMRQMNDLKNDVIDDEKVLAIHGNKIEDLTSYFPSYVPRSEYNELLTAYNTLAITVAYIMENTEWKSDSESKEDYMTGYIIGTATKGFTSLPCEALPATYYSAPTFMNFVPNGRLVGSISHMFTNAAQDNSYLKTIDSFDVDTSRVDDMYGTFGNCNALVYVDLHRINTSHVTTMYRTFHNCRSLTSLDLSNFNTSNVKIMTGMFQGCASLTTLDLRNFNTSKVTNMQSMFANCAKLGTLDISNFDLSNVTGTNGMFSKCDKLRTVYVDNMTTEHINIIKERIESGTSHDVTLTTVNGRKALSVSSGTTININL